MTVYMEVSQDEFELPVAIADTISELARLAHRNKSTLIHAINHSKHSRYIRVVIEEDDDDGI